MDVWLILNGEKIGPIHDFEIRRKIEAGELPPETPAWHEGIDAWKPLREISLFEREFLLPSQQTSPDLSANDDSEKPLLPPPMPDGPHLLRRFWARWLDLYFFSGVWWICMWLTGRDIGATLANPWIILFQYVPWFILETVLLHRYAFTPGKWLLGIRVVNDDGSLLTLAQATRRSSRVLFMGIGFGWGLLAMICQIVAFFTTKRMGRPLWDHAAGHRLVTAPLHPVKVAGFVIFFFIALQLQFIVVAPYAMEMAAKTFPALKAEFEKNPPWHLPPR